ncbi:peptidoglycan-binding LysM domain-containing protein [Striga asiatica]|uniref:Peptidoglycan-binding LysM domain-containing protein n=1 Tax=Striga asiatica TaxID=4170 RepID=A0A5A7QG68_STRAF|nr:peptidoglycan-binding LysM domain-containing protein [Striga asiatica]
MSYVVRTAVDTLSGIAARYLTTATDLMNVNSMASQHIKDDDVLAIPLSELVRELSCSGNLGNRCTRHEEVMLLRKVAKYPAKHVVDLYILDFQSGLRALAKTRYGARATPHVDEPVVVDAACYQL